MLTECDKCGSKIEEGRCDCGIWYAPDEVPSCMRTFEKALYAYDHICEQNNSTDPISGDHHTGNCIVLFKGDYDDCEKVKDFITALEK